MSNLNQVMTLNQEGWAVLKEQVGVAIKSGFLPQSINTPEKAITIALKGQELGIPPLQAFSHINVIQGKPTISSELMLALIYRNVPGAVVNIVESTSETCTIEASRPNGKPTKISFSMSEAKLAGVAGKDSWKKYPAAMLRARCISAVARAVFPDAIMGCSYTPEEIGAEVNEDGEIIRPVYKSVSQEPQKSPVTTVATEELGSPTEGKPPYRIKFGQFAGKTFKDLGMETTQSYVTQLETKLSEGPVVKDTKEKMMEIIAEGSAWLFNERQKNGTAQLVSE